MMIFCQYRNRFGVVEKMRRLCHSSLHAQYGDGQAGLAHQCDTALALKYTINDQGGAADRRLSRK